MKNRLFTLFLLLVCATLYVSAGSARADILMKNGIKYEGVEVSPPWGADKELKAKIDGKKTKITSDSIDMVVIWHKDRPDEQYVIKWMRALIFRHKENRLENAYRSWFALHQAGDHLSYWIEINSFKLKKKYMRISVPQEAHFLWRDCDDGPCKVNTQRGAGRTRAGLTAFLDSDKELCRSLNEDLDIGKWNGDYYFNGMTLYEKLVKEYTPGRKCGESVVSAGDVE